MGHILGTQKWPLPNLLSAVTGVHPVSKCSKKERALEVYNPPLPNLLSAATAVLPNPKHPLRKEWHVSQPDNTLYFSYTRHVWPPCGAPKLSGNKPRKPLAMFLDLVSAGITPSDFQSLREQVKNLPGLRPPSVLSETKSETKPSKVISRTRQPPRCRFAVANSLAR